MTSDKSLLRGFLLFFAIIFAFTVLLSAVYYSVFKKDKFGKPKIAVVRVEGVILSSKKIISELEKYRNNKKVKGIILRVDSVGGGVAPSQEIHEEIKKIRSSGKKVFVSMGSVAASGGYYISCGADKIFANQGTMTGSIGVIMEFPNMQDLMKTIGLKSSVIKSGKYKDIGSPFRKMTNEENKLLQEVIDDVYEQFVSAISEGRNLSKSEVRAVADGRIFSGKKAKELHFVDELGGLQKAIKELAKLCKIVDYEVLEKKEKKGVIDLLLESVMGSSLAKHLSFTDTRFAGLEYRWSL